MSPHLHARRPAPGPRSWPVQRAEAQRTRDALGAVLSGLVFAWFVVAVCVLLWAVAG